MMCSLALPASATVLQTGSRPFNDVVRNSWYYNYVYSAYDQGVFAGLDNHTFGTQTSMTRGMMVTVLYGMAGKPEAKTSVPFTDVEPSRYYAGPVAWAYKNGIVQGLSETVFAPDMNISREQTALRTECPDRRPGRFGTESKGNQKLLPDSTMHANRLQARKQGKCGENENEGLTEDKVYGNMIAVSEY